MPQDLTVSHLACFYVCGAGLRHQMPRLTRFNLSLAAVTARVEQVDCVMLVNSEVIATKHSTTRESSQQCSTEIALY